MLLVVPDDIAQAAEEIAYSTGKSPENVLLEVLQAHFAPFDNGSEFGEWLDRALEAPDEARKHPFVE